MENKLLLILAIAYLVWPIDLVPGCAVDDIIWIIACVIADRKVIGNS